MNFLSSVCIRNVHFLRLYRGPGCGCSESLTGTRAVTNRHLHTPSYRSACHLNYVTLSPGDDFAKVLFGLCETDLRTQSWGENKFLMVFPHFWSIINRKIGTYLAVYCLQVYGFTIYDTVTTILSYIFFTYM